MPEPRIGALPIPATPLSELSRWQLEIRCEQCRRDRSLRLEVLARRYGGNVRIIDVVERLRCAQQREGGRCGAKPSRVVMAEVHAFGGTTRRMREITVISQRAEAAEPG